jgi:hypothetical protein
MTDRFADRLSDYLDGGLEPGARREVEAHLAACADCRAALDDLREIVRGAKAMAENPPEPPRDLWPRIAAETRAGSRRRPLAWGAAAAALMLAIGVTWAWLASRPSGDVASLPRYLLLLHEPTERATAETPEAHRAVVERYSKWARGIAEEGRLVAGEELAADLGWSLRPGAEPAPSPAASEKIGGFFIVRAPSEREAVAIAQGCPHLENGGWIELRRIQDNR